MHDSKWAKYNPKFENFIQGTDLSKLGEHIHKFENFIL